MPSDNRLITNNPLDLAAHIYAPRILGYLGGLAIVYSVLAHADTKQVENPWLLSALFIVSIAWPYVARELTFRSSAPAKTIIQTLSEDILFKKSEITDLATSNLFGFKSVAIIEYETSNTI